MDSLICQRGMAATSEVHGRMQSPGMRPEDWLAHSENVGGGTEEGELGGQVLSSFLLPALVRLQAHSYPSRSTL